VLFIENSIGLSGSTMSLTTLLSRLDRKRFEPYVVLSRPEQAAFIREQIHERVDLTIIGPGISLKQRSWLHAVRGSNKGTGGPLRHSVLRFLGLLDLLVVTVPYALRLRRFARSRRIELIHQNNGFDFGAVVLARMLDVPLVAYQRGDEWNSRVTRWFARGVNRFIANSIATRQSLESLRVPRDRVTIVYPPVDLDVFHLHGSADNARKSLGLGPENPSFGMVGSLQPWKGQRVFLQAARLVLDRLPNARAIVIGGPPADGHSYARELRTLAAELGIADRVLFTGFRPDVAQLLSGLDVVVHASVEPEPFGRVIAEAMAMERPVVASAAGGPLEIIEDGRSGFLVPPGDPGILAERVITLLGDSDLAKRIGCEGSREVAGRFSADSHAIRVQEVYDTALGAVGAERLTAGPGPRK
jgi:glycosyltransferase involved in cell wall biosynthesis